MRQYDYTTAKPNLSPHCKRSFFLKKSNPKSE
jgi:hypothetical protein